MAHRKGVGLRKPRVLGGSGGGLPRLRPPARQATVRHLLTHTAGSSCNPATSTHPVVRSDARPDDATRPDLDIFTNNEAERTIRPVKVAQRSSGGCWRTLGGLADFAVVQSYLSTAAKWGIAKIDVLRGLFNGSPWMPPGLEPAG